MLRWNFPAAGRAAGCCCRGIHQISTWGGKHREILLNSQLCGCMTVMTHCFIFCLQITFPPNIYYKIFTYRPITDVCASSPKDYTQPGVKQPVARQTNNCWPLMQEDRSGWYQRMENNSWRLFCSKVVLHVHYPTDREAKYTPPVWVSVFCEINEPLMDMLLGSDSSDFCLYKQIK